MEVRCDGDSDGHHEGASPRAPAHTRPFDRRPGAEHGHRHPRVSATPQADRQAHTGHHCQGRRGGEAGEGERQAVGAAFAPSRALRSEDVADRGYVRDDGSNKLQERGQLRQAARGPLAAQLHKRGTRPQGTPWQQVREAGQGAHRVECRYHCRHVGGLIPVHWPASTVGISHSWASAMPCTGTEPPQALVPPNYPLIEAPRKTLLRPRCYHVDVR
mmetsp:Transcript_17729/g.44979  ORF Transcript_17729/g.44979 Transcript_17729/m.44979 type:complete len:216 (+) Transcript_17729:254-901(+)